MGLPNNMRRYLSIFSFLVSVACFGQRVAIVDSLTHEPVPFATISFGDGLGTFADDNGGFSFTKKKYSDVDTLFISAMGYAEKAVLTNALPQMIRLRPEVSQLSEVIVSATKEGKFKMKKQKAVTHNDVFACWLPTVESEVAVYFKRFENRATQIAKLLLPINAEAQYKSKGKGKFATIFRIQFYEDQGRLPGRQLGYEEVVFAMDEREDKVYELDVSEKSIFIPEGGLYVSLQVLGYANAQGKLVQSKKYREIKTARGVQKIATSFRPLLPFIKGLPHQRTFVRRIFFNNKKWQVFDKTYNKNSTLIQRGNRNYGMGAEFKVYEE